VIFLSPSRLVQRLAILAEFFSLISPSKNRETLK